jgi:hypothetical protein
MNELQINLDWEFAQVFCSGIGLCSGRHLDKNL